MAFNFRQSWRHAFRRWNHESRILGLTIASGLPGSLIALLLLWTGDYTSKVQWTFTVLILVLWWGFAMAVLERTVKPLQTLANLLEALREGDYSIRAREPRTHDALGEVMLEVNHLGEMLRRQRFDVVDAENLLQKVNEEIDVAVFTFDENQMLRLVNRAGEKMMAQTTDRLLGRSAEQLGLVDCLVGEADRTFERSFPGRTGRWQCRRSSFRESGLPHHLLVLSDLSKALRDEERQAWQSLIRVLGHEFNNSLAPIKSTASTVESILKRDIPPQDWREDAQRGLLMIVERCESLNRFIASYSRLARLPPPKLQTIQVGPLIRRAIHFETRLPIKLNEGDDFQIEADGDQLEQLLINLLKNGVEAALETQGAVMVSWSGKKDHLEIRVVDEGPGLSNTQNLFVPFFTTKPGGTGIGLVLCRQIAEAHGGTLTLKNRTDQRGCEALLRLPFSPDTTDRETNTGNLEPQ